jgi:hypothetical protein
MIAELITSWRGEAERLRLRGLAQPATLIDSMADELEAHLRAVEHETVNLTDAARISGYSADWLGQMIRTGEIVNAGRKHAPRIRLMDLPRKAGCGGDAGAVTVLSLEASRRRGGLEEDQVGRRVRSQGGRDATRRVPEPVSQVGR